MNIFRSEGISVQLILRTSLRPNDFRGRRKSNFFSIQVPMREGLKRTVEYFREELMHEQEKNGADLVG